MTTHALTQRKSRRALADMRRAVNTHRRGIILPTARTQPVPVRRELWHDGT